MSLPDKDVRCPAVGFARSCRDIVTAHTCPKFVTIRGKNPQTGADVDQSGCVDGFLPLLLLENAQQSRQAGAAIESFRNEVVRNAEADREQRDTVIRTLTGRGLALPLKTG